MNKTTQQASLAHSTTASATQFSVHTTYHYKRLVKSIIMELFPMDSMRRMAAVIPPFPRGGFDVLIAVSNQMQRRDIDLPWTKPLSTSPFICNRSWLLERNDSVMS